MNRDDKHDIDSMLELARDVPPPTEADKSRVRTKLAVRLGSAGLATGVAARAAHQAAASGAKSIFGGIAAKWAGVALVAVGLGGGWLGLRRESNEASRTARAPAPARTHAETPEAGGSVLTTPAEAESATGRASDSNGTARFEPRIVAPRKPLRDAIARAARSPAPPVEAPQTVPAAPAEPAAPSLHGNLAVLRGVHAHLSSRHYDDALALLETHGASLAQTPLAEEARALEVMARCGANAPGASEKRDAFEREYPQSVHLARIESACRPRPR